MTDRKGDWMQVYSGGQFWPLDPRPEDVLIEDIAWGLSHIFRYGGHTERPLTVAQHSVMVSLNCQPENALYGLLHDAAEAYIGDMIRPLKSYVPEFQAIEKGIEWAIAVKFDLAPTAPAEVKYLDTAILANEQRWFMKKPPADWNLPYAPVGIFASESWMPRKAWQVFMNRFIELTGPLNSRIYGGTKVYGGLLSSQHPEKES